MLTRISKASRISTTPKADFANDMSWPNDDGDY